MNWRRTWSLSVVSLCVGMFAGCGHSEEEWQAKLRELNNIQSELNAEKAAHVKAQGEVDEAKAKNSDLDKRLKQAGVDMSNLNADLAEQKSALDKLRKDKEQLEAIRKRFELLKQKLDSLTKLGLNVTVRKNRMMIQLPGDVLFDSGKVDLKKNGKEILTKVAEVIRNDADLAARSFQVAGHTDNQPLVGGPYHDNWGLSVMRAREVLEFLVRPHDDKKDPGGGLKADRWSAAGYGETDPVVPNDKAKADTMQKNRRVELVVVPNVEEMLDLKSLVK